jgi:hypothetical protein
MKKILSTIAAAGLLAVGACTTTAEDDPVGEAQGEALTAPVLMLQTWNGGYVANVTIKNELTTATSNWTVFINMNGTTVSGTPWGATFTGGNTVEAKPSSWNATIYPGQTVSFGWQGVAPTNAKPTIYVAPTGAYATCNTNSGKYPTYAAMAVAAARELGRWNPDADLELVNGQVQVKSSAPCTNNCQVLKILLKLQDNSIQQLYDQALFNVADFRNTLVASVDRQKNKTLNTAGLSALMANHKLTFVGGPKNLGIGACGPHYVFQVDYKSNSQPLSQADADKLISSLCLFNAADCGGNGFIGFLSKSVPGCPSGKMCVAIDPLDGDTTDHGGTYVNNLIQYPMNRTIDPDNSLLGTACRTTTGRTGTMTSRCATIPTSCGTLYCVPNP